MRESFLRRTLGMSFDELLNDGRVSQRTDHLLWRLEAALGDLPLGRLLEQLEPVPELAFQEFEELRDSLSLDGQAIWEWERGL